jgi:hypothetical protein
MEATFIILAIFACLALAGGIGKHLVVVLVLMSALGGCASSVSRLQLATAEKVKGLSPEQIHVSHIERSINWVKWTATTSQGQVQCFADDMVRRVVCRP